MHINTSVLKTLAKSLFAFFHFKNVNRIERYHPLNDRGMIRYTLYVSLIVLAWFVYLLCGVPDLVYNFCRMIGAGFEVMIAVGVVIMFMHTMLCLYAGIVLITYIQAIFYANKMFYVYWRLSKHVKFFLVYLDQDNLNKRGMKRTDIFRYFEMLYLYLFIRRSYEVYGMRGEISKRYRGINITHGFDEAARILLRELPERFFERNDMAYLFSLVYNTFLGTQFFISGVVLEIGSIVNARLITIDHIGNTRLGELLVSKKTSLAFYKIINGLSDDDIGDVRQLARERVLLISGSLERDINEDIL